ncbi:hypothetical protein D3273_18185 [Lichenibacterium minor]|uniref:Uncharacterized protein n=1 Tax=Lichenibacterium minor TaxID=2316528 RepID=A0A4Q2U2Q0_9HYPH|nr:hypothetical protein [Lichenibacterium minor]RYC30612.1 hypothetical protein D3273_18185 [Lichenibacterium minor]
MSVLLRHPATVPALFSRAVDPEPPAEGRRGAGNALAQVTALLWAAAVLIEVPLVKAAAAAVGLTLPQ